MDVEQSSGAEEGQYTKQGSMYSPQPNGQFIDQQQQMEAYKKNYEQWMAYYRTLPKPKGPKVPVPRGRPRYFLFKVGGAGFILCGMAFLFWAVLGQVLFPMWFIGMFNVDTQIFIHINIFIYIFMSCSMLLCVVGLAGHMKNLGSKYPIAPIVMIALMIILFLIMAAILNTAANSYTEYNSRDRYYGDYEESYYYGEYDQWDEAFYVTHILSNFVFGSMLIVLGSLFTIWKHVNKMPKLSNTAGIITIFTGGAMLLTFFEFFGVVYFAAAVGFFLMGLAMFNIPPLDPQDWQGFVYWNLNKKDPQIALLMGENGNPYGQGYDPYKAMVSNLENMEFE